MIDAGDDGEVHDSDGDDNKTDGIDDGLRFPTTLTPAAHGGERSAYCSDCEYEMFASIGIEHALVACFNLHTDTDTFLAACESEQVYHYDQARQNWTSITIGEETLFTLD